MDIDLVFAYLSSTKQCLRWITPIAIDGRGYVGRDIAGELFVIEDRQPNKEFYQLVRTSDGWQDLYVEFAESREESKRRVQLSFDVTKLFSLISNNKTHVRQVTHEEIKKDVIDYIEDRQMTLPY